MEFLSHFSNLTDFRVKGRTYHLLSDIVGIAILAVLAECDEWHDIADWAKSKKKYLETYFVLPHGIPSHDTFERIFSMLNPIEFELAFISWVNSFLDEPNKFIGIYV